MGLENGLQASLGNQACILVARSCFGDAMKRLKEQEQICRKLRCPDGLATSLINQANILGFAMDKPREALLLAEEAYRLVTDSGLTTLASQVQGIINKLRSTRSG